jgi:tRNA pseudouridine38-40 synthase
MTVRFAALQVAYDGSCFEGYARSPGHDTVEQALIEALQREGLVAGTFKSGSRTDRGVSALANVVRAGLGRQHLRGLVPALQARLPAGLWVLGAAEVAPDWNPRHAAWRLYEQRCIRDGEDLAKMRRAAACFVGTHRMHAFARVEAHRNPERTVLAFDVARSPPGWAFTVRGESFLWGQVRRMVGACLAVGRGEATRNDIEAALRSGKPHARFGVAPAEGLTLQDVHYDGLRWHPSAGTLGRRQIASAILEAHVRAGLLADVAKRAR